MDAGSEEESELARWARFLNAEITALGFESFLEETHEEAQPKINTLQLVRAARDILLKHQTGIRARDEIQTKLQRCASDADHARTMNTRFQDQIVQLEKDLASLREKERQFQVNLRGLTQKLQAEKEEGKRVRSVMVQRATQYAHETRKKEKENNKLKERLSSLMGDKLQGGKIAGDVLNKAKDGKRKLWSTAARQEEEMHRKVIGNYEERQRELINENTTLRESLAAMQRELQVVLSSHRTGARALETSEDGGEIHETETDNGAAVPSEHFHMPFELVRDRIEMSLKEKWERLKERIRRLETLKDARSAEKRRRRETDRLRRDVEECTCVIEEQEKMLREQLNTKVPASKTPPSMSVSKQRTVWLGASPLFSPAPASRQLQSRGGLPRPAAPIAVPTRDVSD